MLPLHGSACAETFECTKHNPMNPIGWVHRAIMRRTIAQAESSANVSPSLAYIIGAKQQHDGDIGCGALTQDHEVGYQWNQ